MARFSLVRFSVVAAMLAAVWDLRRLAVPDGLPHPFHAPPRRGLWSMKLQRQVSFREAGVPPGWLGLKRPITVFGCHKHDDGRVRGPLDRNKATSLSCRPVRFRRGQEPRASGVSTTRSIVNSNINSPDVVADSGLCPAIGRDGPLHGGRIRPRATFCHGKLPWSLSIIFSLSRRMCHRRLEPVPAQAVVWPWVRERECTSGNQWHAHDRDCQSFYRLARAGQVSAPPGAGAINELHSW